MYDVFEQLLQKYNVTAYRVAKEAGVTQTALSNWKSGRSTPSTLTLQKIADYFGITLDYLMTGKEDTEESESPLLEREKREIGRDLERIMDEIENNERGPLYYNGEAIDNESLELLRKALELGLTQLKRENKVKYNPYKNKKK